MEHSHSDSESEEQLKDPLDGDRDVLREEDEREKLLTASNGDASRKDRRRSKRREKRRKRKSYKNEEGTELYNMEEGGKDEVGYTSSRSSIESSRERETAASRTRRLRIKVLHITLISVTIVMALSLLVLGAMRMSEKPGPKGKKITTILSNGTSRFAPTTILVSLDGFRADFLDRGLTPTLNSFIVEGVSPQYMLPSFPSVTFPNHYTLVTGLYPESHGMVGNQFWDPDLMEEFHYTDPAAQSMQAKWWSEAEPLWVTATKANIESAIHMWPGSEARNEIDLAFVDKYNGTEVLARKLDRVMQFLDLPSELDHGTDSLVESRPQFIAFYVPNVDQDGHRYGPNSTEIRSTISNVDSMLHDLFIGLQKRNLTDIVNVVIVSDHGMATTSSKRLIQLEDLVDTSQIWPTDGWPLHGLRPKNVSNLRPMYDKLSNLAATNPTFDVYLRDENMPAKYHFTNNKRIAPLWIVPKTGWAIVSRKDFDVKEEQGKVFHPRGLHGYDHEHPLMRAIFVARGPAFPHQPNSRLEVFQNTEVYNIVCDSLGITPLPNNGTLRLPLKPVGLHSDNPTSKEPVSPDPPIPSTQPIPPDPSTIPTTAPFSRPVGIYNPESMPTTPNVEDGSDIGNVDEDGDGDQSDEWWRYFIEKVNETKAWLQGLFGNGESLDTDPKEGVEEES